MFPAARKHKRLRRDSTIGNAAKRLKAWFTELAKEDSLEGSRPTFIGDHNYALPLFGSLQHTGDHAYGADPHEAPDSGEETDTADEGDGVGDPWNASEETDTASEGNERMHVADSTDTASEDDQPASCRISQPMHQASPHFRRRLQFDLEDEIEKTEDLTRHLMPRRLGDAEERSIAEAMQKPQNQILLSLSGHPITPADLRTLEGDNWLNDRVVNAYLHLLVRRSSTNPNLPRVYTFDSYFLLLAKGNYNTVRAWTKHVDLFDYDILLVPVHANAHWCMAVVDFRRREIQYFDSKANRGDACLAVLSDYLCREMEDKKKVSLDPKEWTLRHMIEGSQQRNNHDCGVFALMYAEAAALDLKLSLKEFNMPYYRRRIMSELLKSINL